MPSQDPWLALRRHAFAHGGGRTLKRWQSTAASLLGDLGHETARERVSAELGSARGLTRDLIGLVEVAALLEPDEQLLWTLADVADRSFRRQPNYGIYCLPLGNRCVRVLGSYGLAGVPHLASVLAKATYPTVRRRLDDELKRIATVNEISAQELEELVVPDFGLDSDGRLVVPIAECAAQIAVTDRDAVELRWRTATGQLQKSPPAALRRAAPSDVKSVQELRRRLARAYSSQRLRLESLLQGDRPRDIAAWRERYIDHPLVRHLARRLIWQLESAHGVTLVLAANGGFVGADGAAASIPRAARVLLWHPVDSGDQTALAWRAQLESRGVRQPFRQAHREVFRRTDEAPRARQSMRFAGHVVRQNQLAALFRTRGWKYTKQGPWSAYPGAHKELLRFGLEANLEVSQLEVWSNDDITDRYVTIEGLSFFSSSRSLLEEPMMLSKVPERLFSEVSRDVALFTAVPLVATSPDWETAPEELRRYYEEAALSAAGHVRLDFLTRNLAQLPDHHRLSLSHDSLLVAGDLHAYRIHLDSAQVLIEPDGPRVVFSEEAAHWKRPDLDALVRFDDGILPLVLRIAMVLVRDSDVPDPFLRVQL